MNKMKCICGKALKETGVYNEDFAGNKVQVFECEDRKCGRIYCGCCLINIGKIHYGPGGEVRFIEQGNMEEQAKIIEGRNKCPVFAENK